MNDLTQGLQNAIKYIEEHLCEELEISKIAAPTCGLTVG